jgi:hypothetical protein
MAVQRLDKSLVAGSSPAPPTTLTDARIEHGGLMNLRFAFSVLAILALVAMLGCCPAMSHAAGHTATGYLGLETPLDIVGNDRPQDNSPMLKGELHLANLLGPVGLYGGANLNLRKGLPWSKENKLWTGLELPIGHQGLVAYSYFERRFDTADNRYVIGCRYNFKTTY